MIPVMNPFVIAVSMMAAISLYAGLYYFWMYLRRRDALENLSFALTCFSMALYDTCCAGLYGSTAIGQGMAWQRWQFASLALFSTAFTWFVFHFAGRRSYRPAVIISGVMGMLFLAGLSIEGDITLSLANPRPKHVSLAGIIDITYHEADPGMVYLFQYAAMLAGFTYLLLMLISNARRDPRRTRPLLFSLAIFFVAGLNDVLVGAGVYTFIFLLEFAYLVILLAMTRVLLDRFVSLQREVGELNTRLEQKVRERTMELLFSEIGARIREEFGPGDARRRSEAREPALAPVLGLARDLGTDLRGEDLPGRVLERALSMVRADYGFLFLARDDGTLAQAARAESAGASGGAIFSYRQQAVDDAFRAGRCVLLNDTSTGKPSSGKASMPQRTVLAAPVAARGKMTGVCYLARGGPGFTERDAQMVTAFMEYAALVLEGRLPDAPLPDEPSAVTDFSRERVRRAIAYIDENYRFDISREGLASSLGISPYYLGKAFKELTGKKIGDYINEARVREAARRLSDTDESVIDIAFAVGFETLRTFNRAFQRVMNMTPSEYRDTPESAP